MEGLYVIPIEESVPVNWSGFSQVRATLALLKYFLRLPAGYRWFSFHSGQDYPVKPIGQYREFLSAHDPNMLIEVDSNPMLWRCQLYNFFRENPHNRTFLLANLDKLLRNIQRPFIRRNRNIDFKRGSNWFTANRETARKLLSASSPQWQAVWKYTAVPDEHYFQTLSHMLGIPVIPDNYRFVLWLPNQSSPENLREEHLGALLDTKCYFARKFTYEHREILDLLDIAAGRSAGPKPAKAMKLAESA